MANTSVDAPGHRSKWLEEERQNDKPYSNSRSNGKVKCAFPSSGRESGATTLPELTNVAGTCILVVVLESWEIAGTWLSLMKDARDRATGCHRRNPLSVPRPPPALAACHAPSFTR
ncbi:hypothetical protein OIDMADRAFT_48272 [Oidiodendron maius Zn]|uniref:Uncharacterized protein n=1 Tax=Oidiodendron maius (strain Zn) TaxID=913774 RepID=A0A0C3E254_OIDMZ|nr:hypothetical protein OIDMADRAFT_48272 [Oidiodendron maius Zn]